MAAAALTWLTWSASPPVFCLSLEKSTFQSSPLSCSESTCPPPHSAQRAGTGTDSPKKVPLRTDKMNDFNYACTKCPRTFKLQEFYEKHKKVHELKKQHVCDICGFVYGAAKG